MFNVHTIAFPLEPPWNYSQIQTLGVLSDCRNWTAISLGPEMTFTDFNCYSLFWMVVTALSWA